MDHMRLLISYSLGLDNVNEESEESEEKDSGRKDKPIIEFIKGEDEEISDKGENKNNPSCRLCLTNIPQVAFNYCGHKSLCISCSNKIIEKENNNEIKEEDKKCYVCTEKYTKLIKIFE